MNPENKYTIQTSSDNKELALVGLECANCGSNLEIIDKSRAHCLYCGQHYNVHEADGRILKLTIDYGDSREVTRSIGKLGRLLGICIAVTVLVVAGVVLLNMGI